MTAGPSSFLFQCSVTTYEAYNNWPGTSFGGKSLYGFNSVNGAAVKVSFNRPYYFDVGMGAGHFLNGGWEYCMVRFLEKEGYDLSYCTNIDVHENANLLLSHSGYLSVGHDEYWSWNMRANVIGRARSGSEPWLFRGEHVLLANPARTLVDKRRDRSDPGRIQG